MNEIKLIKPTIEYAEDIMLYRQEFIDLNDDMAGCGGLRKCLSADQWLKVLSSLEKEETCPKGMVPSTTYIAVRLKDNKIVGITDFRHNINNPILSVWGGHIGYSVRPKERRRGYAKEMLRQNLINCKNYGIDKVLITCDYDNIASEKTIIANGGIFDKEIYIYENKIKRFWILL